MADETRYALIDGDSHVTNVINIGLLYERVPSIAADGITVNYTETLVSTTVVPLPNMIQPGDTYVNGQFVRANPSAPQFAVVRNRDNVLMMITPYFGDDVAQVVPDPEGITQIGVTTWDGENFVNPEPAKPPAQEPPIAS